MTNPHRFESIGIRLDREWESIRRRPRWIRRARSWAELEVDGPPAPLPARLDDLQELVDATREPGATDAEADALLCRLVALAARDELAGRVVIQRILPGLIARAVRYHSHRDPVDPVEVAVAAAWIAIRQYDWRNRSRHVAASLISDATFQAFRRPLRRRSATEETRSPHEFWSTASTCARPSSLDELAVTLRDARHAGVAAADLDVLRQLVRAGSPKLVAEECGVTPRTIRNRRDAAVRRLRAALAA